VPLSGGARTAAAADRKVLPTLLSGGDDYEILATVAPDRFAAFQAAARAARVPVSRIGRVMGGRGVQFLGPGGRILAFAKASFSHF
jgi:thiamine-monophosphate kinase